jgi:hypothetical protein
MHANPVKNGWRNIQKIDRRGSCRGVEADGSGTNGAGRGAGAGRLEAHDLRLEGEVRSPRRERSATAAAAQGWKSPAKEYIDAVVVPRTVGLG